MSTQPSKSSLIVLSLRLFLSFFPLLFRNPLIISSSPAIPSDILTWTNQILVWFVTDTKIQGKGFTAECRFVDP